MPINRLNDSTKGIAVIGDPNREDSEIAYCENCKEFRNKLHRLVPLIILEGQNPQPDYDNWKQCPICYKKVPVYDVKYSGKLYTDIEGVRNPFEFGIAQTTGVHKKGLQNRMNSIKKKNRKEDYSDDKEVMSEVNSGATITAYIKSKQE